MHRNTICSRGSSLVLKPRSLSMTCVQGLGDEIGFTVDRGEPGRDWVLSKAGSLCEDRAQTMLRWQLVADSVTCVCEDRQGRGMP